LKSKPFFSVITACLNRADFIETAIQSVLSQNFADFEHIIIDGGSTDGTLEVLKKYPHLRVYSEPDYGVYDAFNKGIRLATGQVINFLNSDDRWGKVPMIEIKSQFIQSPELEAVITDAGKYKIDPDGDWIRIYYQSALKSSMQFLTQSKLTGPAINAWFIHRILFDRIGMFDTNYKIAADVEFCIRALIQNMKFLSIDVESYHYLMHPRSLTLHLDPKKVPLGMDEGFRITENFLKLKSNSIFLKKSFRLRYRRLSIRAMKRAIRRSDPKMVLYAIKRYLISFYIK
jgi:glycosyltransferase involved in cell wall biosynthesis